MIAFDIDGVLADSRGSVLAMWSSFSFENGRETLQGNRGVPMDLVEEMLSHLGSGKPLHTLDAAIKKR